MAGKNPIVLVVILYKKAEHFYAKSRYHKFSDFLTAFSDVYTSFSLVHCLHLMKIIKGPGRKKDKQSPRPETIASSATKNGGILKSLPVHRYTVVIFINSGPLRL